MGTALASHARTHAGARHSIAGSATRHGTTPVTLPPAGANVTGRAAAALSLQRHAGNRALVTALRRTRREQARVQRCGPVPCDCPPEEKAAAEAQLQRTAVQRDALTMSITPAYARDLSDAELAREVTRVEERVRTSPTDMYWMSAKENLGVLRAEQSRRASDRDLGTKVGETVPRPIGLPLTGAYKLVPVDGLPADLVDAIPEGVLTEVEAGGAEAVSPVAATAGPGTSTTEGTDLNPAEAAGWGGYSMVSSIDDQLTSYGFRPGGTNTIGLVAIPRPKLRSPGFAFLDPAAPLDFWGHTAVVVRQDGKLLVRGFNPATGTAADLWELAMKSKAVEEGRSSMRAVVSADQYLLKHPRAVTIEWPVDDALARQAFEELHPTGPAGALGHPGQYSASPQVFNAGKAVCEGSNCGLWATQQAEARLGGRVGRAGDLPIADIGSGDVHAPGTAKQGKIMGLFEDAADARMAGRPSPLAGMPHAGGEAVASGMPTKWRVLKAGGRVLMVVGIAADAYEFFSAGAAEKPRVAVGIGGAALGGFAAGAAAGLVCGPGAPVCSIVLGIAGALGGRALFQALFDMFGNGDDWHSPCISVYRKLPPTAGGDCPNCHRIRREQECDDDPFTGRMRMGRTPLELLPPPQLDRITWQGRDFDAFLHAGEHLGGGRRRPLTPQELVQLDALLGITR